MWPRSAALRQQLPATSQTAYFNAGTNGPMPILAIEALHEAAQLEVDAGRIRPGVYEGAFESQSAGPRPDRRDLRG